jgi:hypothetical protein
LTLQPRGFVIQLLGECDEQAIGAMAARRWDRRHPLAQLSHTPKIGCPVHELSYRRVRLSQIAMCASVVSSKSLRCDQKEQRPAFSELTQRGDRLKRSR